MANDQYLHSPETPRETEGDQDVSFAPSYGETRSWDQRPASFLNAMQHAVTEVPHDWFNILKSGESVSIESHSGPVNVRTTGAIHFPKWFLEDNAYAKIAHLQGKKISDEVLAERETARLSLLEGRIDLEGNYTMPGGVQMYQDILDAGGAYYLNDVEMGIIKENPMIVKGRHLIEEGPGQGFKTALIIKLWGMPALISLVDISQEFLDVTRARLIAEGVPPNIIRCYLADTETYEYNRKTFPKIIAEGYGLPVTYLNLGNSIGNHSIEKKYNNLRPHMPYGYIMYVGFDYTIDDDTLYNCYHTKPSEKWHRKATSNTLRQKLSLRGYNQRNWMYGPTVTSSENGLSRTVHYDMVSRVKQELFLRKPPTPALAEPIVIEKGARLENGHGTRNSEQVFEQINARQGVKAMFHRPRPEIPLRSNSSLIMFPDNPNINFQIMELRFV